MWDVCYPWLHTDRRKCAFTQPTTSAAYAICGFLALALRASARLYSPRPAPAQKRFYFFAKKRFISYPTGFLDAGPEAGISTLLS